MPAPPVSFQWKQRLLSHQITSHLNTHIVRISQINLIRILLPGVPLGRNQLHCIWIKLTSCCYSKVSLDCCTLWRSLLSKQCLRVQAVMCFLQRVRLEFFWDCQVTPSSTRGCCEGGSLCRLAQPRRNKQSQSGWCFLITGISSWKARHLMAEITCLTIRSIQCSF